MLAAEQMPAPVHTGWFGPRVQVEPLIAQVVQVAHHGHEARVRHVVGGGAPKQDRLTIGVLQGIGRKAQIEGSVLVAEASAYPPRHEIDRCQHPVAAVRVKDDGTGRERLVARTHASKPLESSIMRARAVSPSHTV